MAGIVNFLGFNPIRGGKTLAQRLVDHRKALGITQMEFAGQFGVDPTTLARWKRGERVPVGSRHQAVAAILRLPADLSISAARI